MNMENFDDELIFDDEEFMDDEFNTPTQEDQPDFEQEKQEDDLTSEVLRLKGISDPDKIKFEDESGAIVERSWDTLSRQEQINILAGEEPTDDTQLSDDEIDLLNAIRSSGMEQMNFQMMIYMYQIYQKKQVVIIFLTKN